jgi:hypothetical protein
MAKWKYRLIALVKRIGEIILGIGYLRLLGNPKWSTMVLWGSLLIGFIWFVWNVTSRWYPFLKKTFGLQHVWGALVTLSALFWLPGFWTARYVLTSITGVDAGNFPTALWAFTLGGIAYVWLLLIILYMGGMAVKSMVMFWGLLLWGEFRGLFWGVIHGWRLLPADAPPRALHTSSQHVARICRGKSMPWSKASHTLRGIESVGGAPLSHARLAWKCAQKGVRGIPQIRPGSLGVVSPLPVGRHLADTFAFMCVLGILGMVIGNATTRYAVKSVANFVLVMTEFSHDHTCAASSETRLVAPLKDRKEQTTSNVLIADLPPSWQKLTISDILTGDLSLLTDIHFSIGQCK